MKSFSSSSSSLLLLAGLLVAVVLLASCEAAPSPVEEDMAGMKNALEYLQQLDKYYSQAARPRLQERERREDVASALMKLSQIRQHYSDVGRPRFGKRAFLAVETPEENFVPASS